jgi:hypothetical protein
LYAGADLLDYPLSAYDPASEWKTPAGAFGEIRETLYFTGGSATGYFRPVYHIEGSFTDTKAGGLIPSLFLCQGVFFAGGDVCSPVQIDAGGTGPVDVFWQPPADSATTRFVFGQPFNLILFFRTSLSIDPSLGSGSLITDNANASFLGSVTIASLNITDSNGDSIAGARSLSDSGLFGVPEPGTLCLCGAALGLAAFGRRLRRPVTDA